MLIHTDNTQDLVRATTETAKRKLGDLHGALAEIEKDWNLIDKQLKEAVERADHLRRERAAIIGSHEDTEKAIKKLEAIIETLPILLED